MRGRRDGCKFRRHRLVRGRRGRRGFGGGVLYGLDRSIEGVRSGALREEGNHLGELGGVFCERSDQLRDLLRSTLSREMKLPISRRHRRRRLT